MRLTDLAMGGGVFEVVRNAALRKTAEMSKHKIEEKEGRKVGSKTAPWKSAAERRWFNGEQKLCG